MTAEGLPPIQLRRDMARIDYDGLYHTYMTLGQIDEGLRAHVEDAEELGIDIAKLVKAREGLGITQLSIREYTTQLDRAFWARREHHA